MNIEILHGKYFIREWQDADAESIVKYANNVNIAKNLRDAFPHPYVLEDANAFLEMVKSIDPPTIFAISAAREAIGSVGIIPGEDVHRYTAELGYWLAEPFWGRGIMTEVVKAMTEWAFLKFKLHRIFAEPYATNLTSARVLEKAGFVKEGLIRNGVFKNGDVLDQWMYARVNDID